MGYKVSEAYEGGGRYLKAKDLQGKEHRLTIYDVSMEQVGREDTADKICLSFKKNDKQLEKLLPLNVTNARALADVYGDDTDDWMGKEIVLYPARVQFQGNLVDAIRVRVPSPAAADDEPPF